MVGGEGYAVMGMVLRRVENSVCWVGRTGMAYVLFDPMKLKVAIIYAVCCLLLSCFSKTPCQV